jgi:hypothetical protein
MPFLVFVLFIVPIAVNSLAIVVSSALHLAEKSTPDWNFYQGLRSSGKKLIGENL